MKHFFSLRVTSNPECFESIGAEVFPQNMPSLHCTDVLHMCFDKFLFWVESRDLSQADNSIIRVSSFPSWVMGSRTFFSVSTTEPWTFCKMNALNPLKFTSHKKNWENWGKKLKLIKTSILPNFQVPNSLFFCKIIKKIIHFIQRKKTLLYYSCQLEIDHVTQLKKETCQSTCNGPKYSVS